MFYKICSVNGFIVAVCVCVQLYPFLNPNRFSADSLLPASFRKLYWTDGDTINMANTDGSNRSILFTSQKGPVGEGTCTSPCCSTP